MRIGKIGTTRRATALAALFTGIAGLVVASTSPAATDATPIPSSVAIAPQPSTSGAVAVANLDSQIEWIRRTAHDTGDPASARQLAGLLLQRSTFRGTYDDLDELQVLSGLDVEGHPHEPAAWLGRAAFLAAVHRFDEARAALVRAEAAGAEAEAVDRARWVVDLATGMDPEGLVEGARHRRQAEPGLQSWADEAHALAAAGRFEEADSAYRAAQAHYRDVSPFPLAWLAFQRGVMWAESADRPDLAAPLYREALRYLPSYVTAGVHLAEIEASAGDLPGAVGRLRAFAGASGDPEPMARLAEYLAGTEPEEAARAAAVARARYAVLLTKHRAAFLDHAAEFHSGSGGDAELGLLLARENLALRPTARAYQIMIGAARPAERPGSPATLRPAPRPCKGSLPR
jgi:tetratricopeptide (TPR) repeat protein